MTLRGSLANEQIAQIGVVPGRFGERASSTLCGPCRSARYGRSTTESGRRRNGRVASTARPTQRLPRVDRGGRERGRTPGATSSGCSACNAQPAHELPALRRRRVYALQLPVIRIVLAVRIQQNPDARGCRTEVHVGSRESVRDRRACGDHESAHLIGIELPLYGL